MEGPGFRLPRSLAFDAWRFSLPRGFSLDVRRLPGRSFEPGRLERGMSAAVTAFLAAIATLWSGALVSPAATAAFVGASASIAAAELSPGTGFMEDPGF